MGRNIEWNKIKMKMIMAIAIGDATELYWVIAARPRDDYRFKRADLVLNMWLKWISEKLKAKTFFSSRS